MSLLYLELDLSLQCAPLLNFCFFLFLVPADFGIDPMTHQPIDMMQRPEMRSAMIEYIAPQEYMVLLSLC